MNSLAKKFESSIQFWIMLGPLFIIGVASVMNIYAASPLWKMPLLSLGGIVLCYLWRWRGCLLACILLSLAMAFQLLKYPHEGIFPYVLFLSFIVSLIVTTLFLDESQEILNRFDDQLLVKNNLLAQLEGKLHASQHDMDEQISSLIEPLKKELSNKEEALNSSEHKVAAGLQELKLSHSQQDKLARELIEVRKQLALYEKEFLSMPQKSTLVELENTISSKDNELFEKESNISQLNDYLKMALEEKKLLEMTISNLQNEYDEIIHKSLIDSDLIEKLKTEVLSLKAAVESHNEELNIEKGKYAEFETYNKECERYLNQQIEELTKKLASTNLQVNDFQRRVHDQNSVIDRFAALQAQYKECLSKESLLRSKLDEMTHLYEKAHATNMSNISILSDYEHFKAEIQILKQSIEVNRKEKENLIQNNELQKIESDRLKLDVLDSKQEIEKLVCEKDALIQQNELQINEFHRRMSEMYNGLIEKDNEKNEVEKHRELCRMEGLYLQLREQFNEKSKVLDSTRRELFCMQEKFLSLQKDFEEKEIYGEHELEKYFNSLSSTIEKELEDQISESNKEIKQLHELVTTLILSEVL